MLAEIESVVAQKNDHRVGGESELIEAVEDASEARISAGDAAMIAAFARLAIDGDVSPVRRRNAEIGHGQADGGGIKIGGPVRRGGRPMRTFVTELQREGGGIIAVNEGENVIGGDIVHPTGGGRGRAVDVEGGIIVT